MDPGAILMGSLDTTDQKTMSLPRGRACCRENRSSGSHQRPRGDGRHGCHEVLARVSGGAPPISGTKVTWLAPNVLLATVLPPHASRFTPHDRRGPPSMPRAELGTALPTRQGSICYEMLRFPVLA